MEKLTTAIIGGGASGLILATLLDPNEKTAVFERGERVGRKLSATGNGQGNITNVNVTKDEYFSCAPMGRSRAEALVRAFDDRSLTEFFASLGVILTADERGRVYPASRQASALTDALRFTLETRGVLRCGSQVTEIQKSGRGFVLTLSADGEEKTCYAENVVLCTGGKAAKNFGTDGSAYALAKRFGHTVTPLYPSLVQLKTDTQYTKTLKGIRINDARVTAFVSGTPTVDLQGDVIFTDYGVSGDAIFRISAYIADKIEKGNVGLSIDFLPKISEREIMETLLCKRKTFPALSKTELLFGIVNNQVGRAVMRRAEGDLERAAKLVKAFPLSVLGSLGFDYAQVTKGGIPLSETDENLQSVFAQGLYFAGEILDVDGACGGYNLQWAYSSACTVARALNEKGRGQV